MGYTFDDLTDMEETIMELMTDEEFLLAIRNRLSADEKRRIYKSIMKDFDME